jgi:hypothetical protein
VGLVRGPLSLVSTTEELLGRQSSGFGRENIEYGLGICHAGHVTPSVCKKLALTSPTSGGRSVGIVRSRTQATEFYSSIEYKTILNVSLSVEACDSYLRGT